jgi:hypothetical protein
MNERISELQIRFLVTPHSFDVLTPAASIIIRLILMMMISVSSNPLLFLWGERNVSRSIKFVCAFII